MYMRIKEEMTKIVAAIFVEYIETPRTLSAFNPDRSAAKKGHRLIAKPAAYTHHGVTKHEERKRQPQKKKRRKRRRRKGKRDEKRRRGRERGGSHVGFLGNAGADYEAAGLNRNATRCDATLCTLIASCTRRRCRYMQRREKSRTHWPLQCPIIILHSFTSLRPYVYVHTC
jgi:hypothetical protein